MTFVTKWSLTVLKREIEVRREEDKPRNFYHIDRDLSFASQKKNSISLINVGMPRYKRGNAKVVRTSNSPAEQKGTTFAW